MLPIEPWFNAMTLEAGLPPRPPNNAQPAGSRGLRRALGRGLIALGRALAGPEAIGNRTVSLGR